MKRNFLLTLLFLSGTVLGFAQTDFWKQMKNEYAGLSFLTTRQNAALQFRSNSKQGLDSLIFSDWDSDDSLWLLSSKEAYTYDEYANPEEGLFYSWNDSIGDWEAGGRNQYTYTPDGQVTEVLYEYWDEMAGDWVFSFKEEFSYNADGMLDSVIGSSWNEASSQWTLVNKQEYVYAAGMTTENFYYWEPVSNQWLLNWKEETVFDALGNPETITSYQWDFIAGAWIPAEQQAFSYDFAAGTFDMVFSNWDESLSSWVATQLQVHYLDAEGNISELEVYLWNENLGDWEQISLQEFTYDNDYAFSDLSLPLQYADELRAFFNHMLLWGVFFNWDSDLATWEQFAGIQFFYSEKVITSARETSLPEAVVSPNPVVGEVVFELPEVENRLLLQCFDLQGREVFSSEIFSGERVNLSALRPGMYVYVLSVEGEKVARGKLVRQ